MERIPGNYLTTSKEKAKEVEKKLTCSSCHCLAKSIAEKSMRNSFILITDTILDAVRFR